MQASAPNLTTSCRWLCGEDVGGGDWTTRWTVDPGTRVEALVVAKEDFVVAGGRVARMVFLAVDPSLEVDSLVSDGSSVQAGALILRVRGEGQGVLTGERTALNFLARLSGIATLTRKFVDEVEGHGARITDTRKTTPGWRRLEKWAVRVGGGVNHRMGLDDMILVKDNHIAAAGSIRAAISRVREENTVGLPVEVELTKAEQLEDLRDVGVDRILLDNMGDQEIGEIVARVSGLALASARARGLREHDARSRAQRRCDGGGVDLRRGAHALGEIGRSLASAAYGLGPKRTGGWSLSGSVVTPRVVDLAPWTRLNADAWAREIGVPLLEIHRRLPSTNAHLRSLAFTGVPPFHDCRGRRADCRAWEGGSGLALPG